MKKLFLFATSLFSFVALSIGTVAAAAPTTWNFSVFEPANTITGRDLSLEYHILSTDPSDSFEVSLSQNGSFIESQAVTNPYGDSGVFDITVPAAGSYSFVVTAENQSGETATETRTVAFADPAAGTATTVYKTVGNPSNNNGSAAASSATTVATTGGVVSDAAASTTKDAGKALGATKSASNDATSNNKVWLWTIPGVAALGGAYYWFVYRQGKGPFAPVQ